MVSLPPTATSISPNLRCILSLCVLAAHLSRPRRRRIGLFPLYHLAVSLPPLLSSPHGTRREARRGAARVAQAEMLASAGGTWRSGRRTARGTGCTHQQRGGTGSARRTSQQCGRRGCVRPAWDAARRRCSRPGAGLLAVHRDGRARTGPPLPAQS
ncbi:hypothetical protein PVAP13_5KG238800 [Panicum virgatum]|uniref:Uncharacterized protein n=1 Tax=Panicum virgatum TaxID=38727 RepID=A0A8T0SK06_PANVG|nr:hypothetical protein PVAP13_5KG238800 [Panicum virgatum]